jgi:hypothetical protein
LGNSKLVEINRKKQESAMAMEFRSQLMIVSVVYTDSSAAPPVA